MKLLAVPLLYLAVLACSTANGQTIQLLGTSSYSTNGSDITISVDRITNYRSVGSISGTLALQIWLTNYYHTGGTIYGNKITEISIGQLSGGYQFSNVSRTGSFPIYTLTHGSYWVVLVLAEWTGFSYETIDYLVFSEKVIVDLPEFVGNVSYKRNGSAINLKADRIYNPRSSSNTSGTMWMELWATDYIFAGASYIEGYRLASARLGTLRGQQSLYNLNYDIPFSEPPNGTYYISLVLVENVAGTPVPIDHINFDSTWTFGVVYNSIFQAPTSYDMGGGVKWNQIGFLYDKMYPFVYIYHSNQWIFVWNDGASEAGFYFYNFNLNRWGWTASSYYPYYIVLGGIHHGEILPF